MDYIESSVHVDPILSEKTKEIFAYRWYLNLARTVVENIVKVFDDMVTILPPNPIALILYIALKILAQD